MQRFLFVAALLLASTAHGASEISLLELHKICDSTDERNQSACSGLLVGIVAGLQMGAAASRSGKAICLPGNFSPEQLKLILDKIVRDGPQFLSLPAIPGLMVPLQVAFPCLRGN